VVASIAQALALQALVFLNCLQLVNLVVVNHPKVPNNLALPVINPKVVVLQLLLGVQEPLLVLVAAV
tara:strand:+ start:216 stop:416 length:201 start_codon:yes stop_codon:yes gene_type:complete